MSDDDAELIRMRIDELERANLRMAGELRRLAAAYPEENCQIRWVLRGGTINRNRPPSLGEIAIPPPTVAAASGEEGAMRVEIRNTTALAELAGVSLEELARIRRQEDKL